MTTVAGVRLSEKAAAACAVTTWRDQVYLAWTGGKMSLNLASSADGREFAGKQQLAHRSYRHQMSTDSSPARNIALSPSLVGHRERLYLAWTGTDAALNVQVVDRHAYSTPITFKQRSAVSPSVTMSERGSLVLAWTGSDRHVNLLTVAENWSGVPVRLPARSSAAPAVCSHRGSLVLAWTGTDRHVNLLTMTENWSGVPVRLPAKSSAAPAVCSHRGSLVLAWTGTDYHLNVGRLP